MTILVTGAAGFIGAYFVRRWLAVEGEPVVGLDSLTYASNPSSLVEAKQNSRFTFAHGDIGNAALVEALLRCHRPRAIVNFAAETHVDRSIDDPAPFLSTNVAALYRLLEAARQHWRSLPKREREGFRFVQISTDEVFGSLAPDALPFGENCKYAPSSPYAASKAAGDHLVLAWYRTFGLPCLIAIVSNTYGPAQFPEKLIPLMTLNAVSGALLPLYGDGANVRDWMFVDDACAAISAILRAGRPGESYCVGARNERANSAVVETIAAILDRVCPRGGGLSYREQIRFVADRPGHDRRYALATHKIEAELGWRPNRAFDDALEETIVWYVNNRSWVVESVKSDAYRIWIERNYGRRG